MSAQQTSTSNSTHSSLSPLQAAIGYAARGMAVFPVHTVANGRCSCGAENCKNPGKHPRTSHGLNDAVKDMHAIRAWWRQWPSANIGIATGRISNCFVLDVDPRHGGIASLDALRAQYGPIPSTLICDTGGGGQHIYFAYPNTAVGSPAGVRAGLDIRGDGGYVVAPPSVHLSGNAYVWRDESMEPTVAPGWLLQLPASKTKPRVEVSTNPWQHLPFGLALAEEVAQVRVAVEGTRNHVLFGAALRLQRLVRVGRLDRKLVVSALAEAACAAGLDDNEIETTIQNASARVQTEPCAMTDLGNAERMWLRHGDVLHYSAGAWLRWNGQVWERNPVADITQRAKEIVININEEAEAVGDPEIKKKVFGHALRSAAAPRIAAMITLLQTEPGISIGGEKLDANPNLLNCANGTVDLTTGELHAHDPSDLITRMIPLAYDPMAVSTRFDERLIDFTGGRLDLMEYLQLMAGYCATGSTKDEKIFLIVGPGGSGKSTFVDALKNVLGDYAAIADFDTFLKRQNSGGARNDVARLAGKRLVVALEADEGAKLATGLVKSLTGGDTVAARYLYKETEEYKPQLKLLLAANDKPAVSASDTGFWRRIDVIPFDNPVPPNRRDNNLKAELTDPEGAGPAVLRWVVEGAVKWYHGGLSTAPTVAEATDAYRAEMDTAAPFLDEHCLFDRVAWTPVAAIRDRCDRWAVGAGVDKIRPTKLAQALKLRACEDSKRRGVRGWAGVKLRPVVDGGTAVDTDF